MQKRGQSVYGCMKNNQLYIHGRSAPDYVSAQFLQQSKDALTIDEVSAVVREQEPWVEGGLFARPHIKVIRSAIAALLCSHEAPVSIYPNQDVLPGFIEACVRFFRDRCGIATVSSENITLGIGSSQIIDAVFYALIGTRIFVTDRATGTYLGEAQTVKTEVIELRTAQGEFKEIAYTEQVRLETGKDIVLTEEGYYHSYAEFPNKWGGELVAIPHLTKAGLEHFWRTSPEQARRVKCLLLINPAMANGRVRSREELEGVAEFVRSHHLIVVSDEIYRHSIFQPEKHRMLSFASLPGMIDCTVTTYSGSKELGTANLRIGWGCGPKEIIALCHRHSQYSITTIPLVLQAAGKALLDVLETEPAYLQEVVSELRKRRDTLYAAIEELNISCWQGLRSRVPTYARRLEQEQKQIWERIIGSYQNSLYEGQLDQEELDRLLSWREHLRTRQVPFPFVLPTLPYTQAGHSVVLDFSPFVTAGEGIRDTEGQEIKNSLDLVRCFSRHGITPAPMHGSGIAKPWCRFAFGQFGYEYCADLAEREEREQLNISPSFIPSIDVKRKKLSTMAAAYEAGRDTMRTSLKRMGMVIEDLLCQQV